MQASNTLSNSKFLREEPLRVGSEAIHLTLDSEDFANVHICWISSLGNASAVSRLVPLHDVLKALLRQRPLPRARENSHHNQTMRNGVRVCVCV